ncbi:MFS transporter [Pararobbsia silviterrae]|uniref:MFS transporter n=1 Tax=Pararobbsia silviterrae TaxID=1792498 RepID=A0A494X611_9BURK|nr:aromatic acid/H+ symport family MFS transporter [Pararobbsia silviterrae]RKP46127.1 MFS transporter [Pararobbsia silviterrae]
MANARLSLEAFVDSQPLSRAQIRIGVLCFLAVLLDGFDSILVGYLAPAIKTEWGLTPPQLAPLFGSGVFGLMVGAMAIGPFADRFGRKTILIASVAVFGLLTLAASLATSMPVFIALRFFAGLGLGATMPCAITLTSEYCPRRHRSLMVTTMFCGFTAGAAISGLAAAWIVSDFGWRAVLVAGGMLPILFLPALLLGIPESLRFLSLRDDAGARIARIASRLFPHADIDAVDLATHPDTRRRFPVADLLARDVRHGTVLIWVVYFANLLVLLFLNSWLPTLLTNLGMTMVRAAAFTSTFQIGGALGSIGLGYLMDRWSPCRVLAVSFGVGVLALLAAGHVGTEAIVLLPLMFAIGVGTGGAQTGAHVVTSSFYRTSSRATGMSWALGIGRIGSVIGSMAGGYLLGLHWSASAIWSLLAGVLLVAAWGAARLIPLMRHAALASAADEQDAREHASLSTPRRQSD